MKRAGLRWLLAFALATGVGCSASSLDPTDQGSQTDLSTDSGCDVYIDVIPDSSDAIHDQSDSIYDAPLDGASDLLDLPSDLLPDYLEGDETEDLEPELPPVDSDQDGLSDQAEAELGTDPLDPDSDDDGILDGEEVALGINPLKKDSDDDGIEDGTELSQETDPADPGSALAYHPEWNQWPRLVFGPESLEALRSRAANPPYPADYFWQICQGAANATPASHLDSYLPTQEYYRSRTSKNAAFVALMTEDEGVAQRALDTLLTLNPNVHEVGFDHPEYDMSVIFGADALEQYLQTYDFLMGLPGFNPDGMAQGRERLLDLLNQYEANLTGGAMLVMIASAQNNHTIKATAAMGMGGLVFNDNPDAARRVNRAVTDIHYYLTQLLVSPEGGYAEGISYFLYAMENYLPFLVAQGRLTQGAQWHYRNYFLYRDPEGEEVEILPDLRTHPTMEALHEWLLAVRMPNRHSPNFDDSQSLPLPGVFMAGALNDPLFACHLTDAEPHLEDSSHGVELAADTFALWSQDWSPVALDWEPNQCAPEAGTCVLRTGWDVDDTYLLLLGEHGAMVKEGGQHEHPDANHITFFAHERPILMDGGYIRWSDKNLVDKPQNHNIVLVDGLGPPDPDYFTPGSDTFITDFQVDGTVSSASSATEYADSQLKRTVALVGYDLVVVADEFSGVQPRDFEVIWHGNGGGTNPFSFEELEGGGSYLLDTTSVWLRGTSTLGAPGIDHQVMMHSFEYADKFEHEALSMHYEGTSGTAITVVALTPVEQQSSPISAVNGDSSALTVDFLGDSWVARGMATGDSPASVTLPCGEVTQTHTLLLVHCAPDGASILASWHLGSPLVP